MINSSDEVFVGEGSRWGNPFVIGKAFILADKGSRSLLRVVTPKTARDCVDFYRIRLESRLTQYESCLKDLIALRGKSLVCSCSVGVPCHVEVLKDLCNRSLDEWPWTIEAAGSRVVEDTSGKWLILPEYFFASTT